MLVTDACGRLGVRSVGRMMQILLTRMKVLEIAESQESVSSPKSSSFVMLIDLNALLVFQNLYILLPPQTFYALSPQFH